MGEGAVGGVEDGFGFFGDFLCEEEDLKEVRADFDGGVEWGLGEEVQLGFWVVVGGGGCKF